MLLKQTIKLICLSLIVLSTAAFAKGKWKIEIVEKVYFITDGEIMVPIEHSGKPKIVESRVEGPLTIVEYFSGDYGTSNPIGTFRRIVFHKEKLLLDSPYKYKPSTKDKKIEQPVWGFDFKKRSIKVKDDSLDDGDKLITF